MPLTMELAIETQPTVVFALSHLNRRFLSEQKRRQLGRRPRPEGDHSGFPAQLQELLELPCLQPCGHNDIGHDLKRLQRYGVRVNGGLNVRKLAQRQGFSNANSLEDLCRHYLPSATCAEPVLATTTKACDKGDAIDKSMVVVSPLVPTTAVRYQLVGRALLDLKQGSHHNGTTKRVE
jgi:hypothetical protein